MQALVRHIDTYTYLLEPDSSLIYNSGDPNDFIFSLINSASPSDSITGSASELFSDTGDFPDLARMYSNSSSMESKLESPNWGGLFFI